MNTCKTCKWWLPMDLIDLPDYGMCNRFPPHAYGAAELVKTDPGSYVMADTKTTFPVTYETNHCGEHSEKGANP